MPDATRRRPAGTSGDEYPAWPGAGLVHESASTTRDTRRCGCAVLCRTDGTYRVVRRMRRQASRVHIDGQSDDLGSHSVGPGVSGVWGGPAFDVRQCCHGRNRCDLRRVSSLEDSWRQHRCGRRLHLRRLPGGRQAVHRDPRRHMGRSSPEFRDIRQLQRGAVSAGDTAVSRDPWLSQLRVAIQPRNKRPDSRARSLRGRPGGPRQPPIQDAMWSRREPPRMPEPGALSSAPIGSYASSSGPRTKSIASTTSIRGRSARGCKNCAV